MAKNQTKLKSISKQPTAHLEFNSKWKWKRQCKSQSENESKNGDGNDGNAYMSMFTPIPDQFLNKIHWISGKFSAKISLNCS